MWYYANPNLLTIVRLLHLLSLTPIYLSSFSLSTSLLSISLSFFCQHEGFQHRTRSPRGGIRQRLRRVWSHKERWWRWPREENWDVAYGECAYYHGGDRLRSFVVSMGYSSAWLDRRDFDFGHFLFYHLFHFHDARWLLPCAGSCHRKTKLHLHGRCSFLPWYVFRSLFFSILPFSCK